MERIKVGLAAFGMSGKVFHAPFLSTNPHFELRKIVERSKELSKEFYPQTQIVRTFSDLLTDDIDLIIVNTPDSTHYEYCRQALEAGKHIVVEKPFTTTIEQGEELICLAEKKHLTLSVFQNRRWDADFLTVQEIIHNKYLGRLVEYESTFQRYRNFIKPNTWKETGEAGGGLTYNLGSHLIDQALVLFGMPEAVYAETAILRDGGKVDDYFVIRLLYPNIKVNLKASYLMKEPLPRFVLHGTLGSYIKYGVDKQEAALVAGGIPNQPHWGEEAEEEWGIINTEIEGKEVRQKYPSLKGNYGAFYQNIYEHIKEQKPLITDARQVIQVIKVIEAAYKSSKERTVITIN